MRVYGFAGIARSEFGGHGLAEDDRACRAQRRDASGVPSRPVMSIDRRAVFGRHVRGRNDIFDRDRHAVQRSAYRTLIKRPRLAQDVIRVEMYPRTDRRLALGNALEMLPRHP